MCPDTVHRVWGGADTRGDGSPFIDTKWEGNKQEKELENQVPQWGAMHLQDGFPNFQGTNE